MTGRKHERASKRSPDPFTCTMKYEITPNKMAVPIAEEEYWYFDWGGYIGELRTLHGKYPMQNPAMDNRPNFKGDDVPFACFTVDDAANNEQWVFAIEVQPQPYLKDSPPLCTILRGVDDTSLPLFGLGEKT
jgi:hypothetical protein